MKTRSNLSEIHTVWYDLPDGSSEIKEKIIIWITFYVDLVFER